MKKRIIWIVKMATFYSMIGIFLQGLAVSILLASTPTEAQNPREVKIKINAVNITLEKTFQLIEKNTNYRFLYNSKEIPLGETVGIDYDSESIYKILESLAQNFNLSFNVVNEQIIVKKSENDDTPSISTVETCSVKGYVTDADTKEALQGVTVKISGTTIGTFTDKRGYYEINNLRPGKYSVVASYVGYAAVAKEITLSLGKTVEINFQMGQSAMNLDEVVVTGSVSERSIKESANPITIISPKELESRDLSSLTSILSSVPGVMPLRSMGSSSGGKFSDLSIMFLNIRGYSPTEDMTANTKIFLDGIELYNPLTVNLLDLNQIEKIEISRGPMSSTLYGAGSSGGVIQLFTKKGSGNLRVNFRSMFTSQENKYQDKSALNSDYELSINGGKGDFGYRTSLTYSLTPNTRWATHNDIDETALSLSAGVFGVISNVKIELSTDYNTMRYGNSNDDTWYKIGKEEGWLLADYLKMNFYNVETKIKTTNIGLTLKQPITNNMYHNLTVGTSGSNYVSYNYSPYTYSANGSTYYYNYTNEMLKQSVKYFINVCQPLFNNMKADITAGIDYNKAEFNTVYLNTATPHADNQGQKTVVAPTSSFQTMYITTTGLFGESVWGLGDALFLTTGIRFEKNTSYADENKWFSMPRIGLTYVTKAGDFTIKPRVSWGKSTQALSPSYKIERIIIRGNTTTKYLKNPDLSPQQQSGYEAGADIFFTNNISFGITYYDQKVKDLVQLTELPSTELKTYLYQYKNVSEVLNKGVEISTKMLFHPLTFDLAYTYCKSTYGKGYEANVTFPYLVEGGRALDVPSGTLFARVGCIIPSFLSWTNKGGSISLEYLWSGDHYGSDIYEYYKKAYNGETINTIPYTTIESNSQINLRGDYSILDNAKIFIDISNLLDDEGTKTSILRGRRISFGLNLSY